MKTQTACRSSSSSGSRRLIFNHRAQNCQLLSTMLIEISFLGGEVYETIFKSRLLSVVPECTWPAAALSEAKENLHETSKAIVQARHCEGGVAVGKKEKTKWVDQLFTAKQGRMSERVCV